MSNYFFTYYENPGYGDLVREEVEVLRWHYDKHWPDNYTFPGSFVEHFRSYYFFELAELKPIFMWAVFFTIIRYFFERFICRPLVKSLNLDSHEDRKKFPESFWKCITYSFFWTYCAYLLLVKYDYFLRPYALWIDWTHGMPIEEDIKLLYFIECGFYVHSVYATLFMDAVRKDFVAMIIHHILTLALINVSYSTRYHKIGILVIFCHDVTDILLEFSKCNFYMKRRNGKFYRHNDTLATIGFAAFTLTWFVFRLYWYPLKIMYSAGCAAPHVLWYRGGGLYEFFNTLLWLLLILDVYWFYFILKILFKALKGGEMSDSREAEFDQKKTTKAD